MKDLKITKGIWTINDMPLPARKTIEIKCNGEIIAAIKISERSKYYSIKQVPDKYEANAKLITEAGNVANETGLMPRELLDERDTYKAILNDIREMWCDNEINMRTINEAMEAFESYLATE